eukprot:982626-Amphidinium_carterae.2
MMAVGQRYFLTLEVERRAAQLGSELTVTCKTWVLGDGLPAHAHITMPYLTQGPGNVGPLSLGLHEGLSTQQGRISTLLSSGLDIAHPQCIT